MQSAVIAGRQIVLGYVAREVRRVPAPCIRSGCDQGRVVVPRRRDRGRSAHVPGRPHQSVETTDEAVVRPEGFELADAWQMITTEVEQVRRPVVRALVDQRAVSWCATRWVRACASAMAVDDGRVEVEIRSHNEHSIAGELAGFGNLVEVLEPHAVRDRLAALAGEIGALYRGTAASANSAIDVNRHVGDTSPDGVAVAPVPPLS